MGRKTALTFNAAEVTDTESQNVYAEWSSLLRLLDAFSFGLLFALATFGIVMTAASWRRLWILYAIAATYAMSVIAFFVLARYRFPIVPPLMLLAAGGVAQLKAGVTARRVALAAGLAGAAAAFAHVPHENAAASRANHFAGLATALERADRTGEALELYKRALDEVPDLPVAHFGLGTLLSRSGRHDQALAHLAAAIASQPAHAEARYKFGLALAASGRTEEAAPSCSRRCASARRTRRRTPRSQKRGSCCSATKTLSCTMSGRCQWILEMPPPLSGSVWR